MLIALAILKFLKANWIPVAIGVACLALMGYIKVLHLEIEHYKAKEVKLQLAVDAANVKEKELEQAATQLTAKYHESLANQFKLQDAAGAAIHERIVKNAEANSTRISPDIIQLFNSSKPPTKLKDPAGAKQGNDARSTPIEEDPRYSSGYEAPLAYEHTLAELLDVSAYNDGNHEKCIDTVHEWQKFWRDYTMAYKAVATP